MANRKGYHRDMKISIYNRPDKVALKDYDGLDYFKARLFSLSDEHEIWRDRIKELERENERRGNLLEDVVNEVAYVEPQFYSPNAVGTPVYLEPEPAEMVSKALELLGVKITTLERENAGLRGRLGQVKAVAEGSITMTSEAFEAIESIRALLSNTNSKGDK